MEPNHSDPFIRECPDLVHQSVPRTRGWVWSDNSQLAPEVIGTCIFQILKVHRDILEQWLKLVLWINYTDRFIASQGFQILQQIRGVNQHLGCAKDLIRRPQPRYQKHR